MEEPEPERLRMKRGREGGGGQARGGAGKEWEGDVGGAVIIGSKRSDPSHKPNEHLCS